MLVVTDRRKAVAMLVAMGGGRADITAVFFLRGGLIGVVGASGVALGHLLINAPDLAVMLERLGAPLLQTDVYPLAFVPVDIRWRDDHCWHRHWALGARSNCPHCGVLTGGGDARSLTAFAPRMPLASDRIAPHRIDHPVPNTSITPISCEPTSSGRCCELAQTVRLQTRYRAVPYPAPRRPACRPRSRSRAW